ncbi:MAG: T9SS type A sorting domain-containing protein, partial [Bacteroidetes bacterium]
DANAGQYFEGTNGHATSAVTYAKIHSQAWDYVVLQDNQGYFAGYINQVGASHMAANIQVRDSVRAIHPCAKVIWFSGWAYLGGIPAQIPGDNTINMNNRIDTNYQYMQNQYPSKKELIAPFGKTWNNAIQAQPAIENLLYISDGVHPSATGQLSNASVLYTMIFKQDPSNINYVPAGVTAANASLLKNLAWQTVMTPYIYNSHQMPQLTPVVTNNSGVLSVSGTYSAYQWYLNNAAIAGATSSTYTPTANGSYMVIATSASNNCAQNWSFPVVVTATGIHENENIGNVVLYPNPVSCESVIELKNTAWEGCRIEIVNMVGQIMQSQPLTSNRYFIYKNDFNPIAIGSGIYIYTITDKSGNKFFGKINIL